jgi:hypothetical protein
MGSALRGRGFYMKTVVGWVVFFVLGMLVQKYKVQIVEFVKKLFKKEGGQ